MGESAGKREMTYLRIMKGYGSPQLGWTATGTKESIVSLSDLGDGMDIGGA